MPVTGCCQVFQCNYRHYSISPTNPKYLNLSYTLWGIFVKWQWCNCFVLWYGHILYLTCLFLVEVWNIAFIMNVFCETLEALTSFFSKCGLVMASRLCSYSLERKTKQFLWQRLCYDISKDKSKVYILIRGNFETIRQNVSLLCSSHFVYSLCVFMWRGS